MCVVPHPLLQVAVASADDAPGLLDHPQDGAAVHAAEDVGVVRPHEPVVA